jgi:molybdenum cofactor cytidylyltransferase
MNVAALLLAAGYARRFGSDKRLLPVPAENPVDQLPLLKYTLSRYLSVFDQCVVVVREPDPALAILERMPDVNIVRQANARAGMGDNIALAMQQGGISTCDALAIALADMPLVQTQTLSELREHARRDRIICPQFEGQRGHPVIFGSALFSDLSQLCGDIGARRVLSAHAELMVDIAVDDEGVLIDIDTAADWERWRDRL